MINWPSWTHARTLTCARVSPLKPERAASSRRESKPYGPTPSGVHSTVGKPSRRAAVSIRESFVKRGPAVTDW